MIYNNIAIERMGDEFIDITYDYSMETCKAHFKHVCIVAI